MTEQTSRLAITIDSTGARKSADNLAAALNKMARAGEEAEKAADGVSNASNQTSDSAKKLAQSVEETHQRVAAFSKRLNETGSVAKASGALQDGLTEAYFRQIAKIKDLSRDSQTLRDVQAALRIDRKEGNITQQDYLALISQTTSRVKELRAAEDQRAKKQAAFIQGLKNQVAVQSLSRDELLRAKAAQLGVGSAADVYIKKLTGAGKTTERFSLQTAAARRELGVMLAELARGNIGALRNSSITLANRSGLFDQLMSPKMLAATGLIGGLSAAVLGLGVAYYKGSQEQSEFYKSLVLTGNQVGKTSGQLADMAARVSVAANSTTGAAASTLNQLVSSGKVAASSLERVTTAIVKTSDATGISTDKLVDDFNKIAENPTQAIGELNDKYHFLTLATYNQVKALQDEGKQQEAARVASEAYSSAMIQRSNDIRANLGLLESAWVALGRGAKSAWDAMFDIGREKSLEQLLADAQKRVKNSTAGYERDIWGNVTGLSSQSNSEINFLQSAINLQGDLNGAKSASQKQQDMAIKSQDEFNKLVEAGQTAAEKRVKVEAQLNRLISKNKKDAEYGVASLWTPEDIAKARLGIEKQFKDPKTPKGKSYSEDAATRLLDQLNRQHEVMQQQLKTTEKIGTAEQALVKWKSQLSEIQKKGILTAEQKSLLANQASITAQYEKNAALEKEIALRKDADKLTAYKNTLSSGLQNDAIGLQNSLNSNTGLSQEQKRQQELTKIASDYQKKQVELTNQRTTGQISQSLYDDETAALQQALNQRLAMQQAYYSQLDRLNGDWQLGVQNGLQSYLNSIPTLYDSVTAATTSILSSTESAISSNLSAMIQGTESLSDGFKNMATGMGQAVIGALTKMAAQWLVYQAVQMLVGKTAAIGAATSMIGQATAMSQVAAINAYASAAAIPEVGWLIAPAAMASAEAMTTPLIGAVAAGAATMLSGPGYSSGGYTGPGGKYDPAGIVHKGEYVFDKASTNRIGVSQLEALRNGKPLDATLSKPGFGTGVQNVNNNSQSVKQNVTIHQSIDASGLSPQELSLTLDHNNKKLLKEMKTEMTSEVISPKGVFGKALKSRYVRGYKE